MKMTEKTPSTMFKTKIIILGPCKSGKTTIANYLADATENFGGEYRPTHGKIHTHSIICLICTLGVRIVEFESNDLELNGRNIDAEVELWDCSGDRKFVYF
jgi:Rab-like protein 5